MRKKQYICIDLKSFYASVECVERGLDPMTTNLVVADPERSEKTICLAVSPSMKALGVKNRCRVFEIPKTIEYIMASPRMQKYIDYAAQIYGIYLRYFAKEDIHVYSIDEVFIDVTPYMSTYKMNAKELTVMLMDKIREEVGVRATGGIGTNLYLAKIALDITAKHADDFIGVLDEESYREKLWDHRPMTDFWRIGPGIARRLESMGIYTMRQLAAFDEDLLYRAFGVDAELLIDHAYGIEPVTLKDIKQYAPKSTSIGSGQVLMRDYTKLEGRTIVREMVELLCLDLVKRNQVTESVTVHVGYSKNYGRPSLNITSRIPTATNSVSMIIPEVLAAYDKMVANDAMVRRFNISCNNLADDDGNVQMSMFDTTQGINAQKDKQIQTAINDIKAKFGKNAMFKAYDLQEEATTLERNRQIGGHKSGE